MGYRLHYAQNYNPVWQGGYFNWASECFTSMFYDHFGGGGWINEDGNEAEVYRKDVEDYIKVLLKKPKAFNQYFEDNEDKYTNQEVADVFTEILQSDDEYIRLEWF